MTTPVLNEDLIQLLEDVQPWLSRALGDAPMWGQSAATVLTRVQDAIETLTAEGKHA